MGLFDKALAKGIGKLDVEALTAKLTEAVHAALAQQGHAQHAGWTGDGSWWVECLDTECMFIAQGSSGGILACNKMAEVHLMELKDATDGSR